jgi:polyribonucleotide nucleotidyltransferase
MVKVLALEGNRIKLSRKALIKEQKAKLAATTGATPEQEPEPEGYQPAAQSAAPPTRQPRHEYDDKQPKSNQSTIMIEGGDEFGEEPADFDEDNEPNFNRADGGAVPVGLPPAGGGRPQGGGGGGAANNNNRRRRRRRPGPPRGGGN